MTTQFEHQPIGRQLTLLMVGALVVIFAVLVWIVQHFSSKALVAETEHSLEQESKIMVGMLDSLFEGVKARGERQSSFFVKYAGGEPLPGQGTMRTGEVDLPVVRIGDEVVNGNDRLLKSFKNLTGDEAGILAIKDGKLYRLSTLLADKDGKALVGSAIASDDPLAKAVLQGQDYSGLSVRGGKYYFGTSRVLKGADGKPWGAYSVRISLEAEMQQVRQLFGSVITGKTGYVYILRPTDDKGGGEFVLHPSYQEKTIAAIDQADGVKAHLAEILARKDGTFHFDVADSDGSLRPKLLQVATSRNWGWTLVVGSWVEEYLEGSKRLRNVVIGAGSGAAILLAALILLLVRQRLAGLATLAEAVDRLGKGDLRAAAQHAAPGSRNEVHQIGSAFNAMVDSMRTLVNGVASTSRELGNSADELSSTASTAMQGAAQQSESAAAIAASVEEMSVSITEVAENARQATRISEEAKSLTESGRGVVDTAVRDLEEVADDIKESAALIQSLGERSQQISSVVGVIREIAEQTNLLALNAAIEAARAGEQGRGFAVVADEVRKLAERTALSTREIATTVQSIIDETAHAVARIQTLRTRMTGSVDLAREAGQALAEIDVSARQAVATVQSIAASTHQQSGTSQEIARLVERIARMADGSSGRATQNSERAGRLQRLAAALQAQLARFTT